jgi:uncharacterized repeat protein (TIGR01451 family)
MKSLLKLFKAINLLACLLFITVAVNSPVHAVQSETNETLCYTQRITSASSFNIYTGKDDPNNPITWTHTVPAGILNSVVRVGLYIEAWDVDYPPQGDEYDHVYFNGYDLGYLQGQNNTWHTVEKTVPVEAIKEGVNELKVYVDELDKTWMVTIRASELRFYCSTPDPDFSIGITPDTMKVIQGESTSGTVNLIGLNGFNSPVNLTVTGLPSGAAGNFSLNPAAPSPTADSQLNITTTASTPAGIYTLTITGESGGIQHQATAQLSVQQKAPEPGFYLVVSPPHRTIYQGDATFYTVTVHPENGFSRDVQLTVDGLPSGASAIFQPNPQPVNGESKLDITTTSQTPTGKYILKVTGTAGEKTYTENVTLTIKGPEPTPDFIVEAAPAQQEIIVGKSAQVTVTVNGKNNFDSPVQLSLSGVPNGLTGTFSPESVTPTPMAQSVLQLSTTVDLPLGEHTLTVTGQSGNLSRTVQFKINVVAPPPEPDFTIAADPVNQEITRGDSATFTVTVTGENQFSSPVSLSISGFPQGMTGTLSIDAVTPAPTAQSTMGVATAADLPAGEYRLTITGTSGNLRHIVKVYLKVKDIPPDPDFTITAAPASQSIIQGQAISYVAEITGLDGFTEPVNLGVTGLPAGAAGAFSVNPIAAGPKEQSTLNITTAATVAAGNYTLIVTAEGGGKTHTAIVALTISPKPPDPDFTLSVSPPLRTVQAGSSTDYTVQISALNDFSGPVDVTVEGLPASTTAAFQVETVDTAGETVLTIDTGENTPAGKYTLIITGKDSGNLSHNAQVILEVTAKAPEPDFTIDAQEDNQEVIAGESAAYKLKLTALNGFNGPVELSLAGLPGDCSGEFQPAHVRPTGESNLTVKTGESTPAGSYKLTVTARSGKANGSLKRSTTVTLVVEEKPLEPDFEMTVTPASQTLHRGDTALYTVKITPLNGFAEEVSLGVQGTPAGADAVLESVSVTLSNSVQTTLKVAVGGDTPLGGHALIISAKSGELEHSVSVQLKVECREFGLELYAGTTAGSAPLPVHFKAKISGSTELSPTDYSFNWNFGDGKISDLQDVEHTYLAPGRYQVVLSVTDPCGKTETRTEIIDVERFEGSITKAFSVPEAQTGQEVFFTLTVKNETRHDYENIVIRDPLSPALEYRSDNSGVSPRRTGNDLEWSFPRLKKGETLSFNVIVNVSESAQPGLINNTAYLSHESMEAGDSVASNTAVLKVQQVDVRLLKQVEQTTARPGDTVKYQLTLTNQSSMPVTGVTLMDELPSSLVFMSQTMTQNANGGGLQFSRQGRRLYWKGTVDAQQKVVIVFKSRVGDDVMSGTRIENTARLEALQLKIPVDSNTVATDITSEPVSMTRVRFTKRSEVPQTEVGRIIRFNITVANQSNSTLIAPVIEDHLPQGFSYVKGSTLVDNQSFSDPQGSRRLLWQLPNIGPSGSLILRYQVVIGADTRRGRNVNRAELRTMDNTGQTILLESSAFVNVSTIGIVFYSGIEGTVYLDTDRDEYYTMADTPLEGIEVRMSTGQKAYTDSMGRFSFEGLFPGEYAVGVNRMNLPEKYQLLSPFPRVVVLTDGLSDTVDFAVKLKNEVLDTEARLQGNVFYDKNRNQARDPVDIPLKDFSVKLDGKLNTNGSNGTFIFTRVKPGEHQLEVFYDGKTVKKSVNLKAGRNELDIPLRFTGIKIVVRGGK